MSKQLAIYYGFEFSIYSQAIPDNITRVLDEVVDKGVHCHILTWM